MKIVPALVAAMLLAGCATAPPPPADLDPQVLVGTWKVDLRPLPTAAEYFQEFTVTSTDGKTFTGSFYGTPVSQARINSQWGAVRLAFVTEDRSGPYNHSAVLVGGKLEGLTNSTGRDFLAYWSAVKQ